LKDSNTDMLFDWYPSCCPTPWPLMGFKGLSFPNTQRQWNALRVVRGEGGPLVKMSWDLEVVCMRVCQRGWHNNSSCHLSDSTSEPLGSLTGTIRLSVLQQQTPETFLIFRLQPNMRYLHPQGKQFTLLLTSKSCHGLSLALSILSLCFRSPVPENNPRHTRYMWNIRNHLISGFKIIYLPCLATTVSIDHDQTKILAFSGELFPTGMDYFHGNLFVLSLNMLPLPPPKKCQWYPGITTNLPWILSDLLVSVCSLSSQGNPHTLDFRSMSKRR
jgi:hypothetical protein